MGWGGGKGGPGSKAVIYGFREMLSTINLY